MRVRGGWGEGPREAKFVRTCPGSEPPSLRVAAGSCGGSLPLPPLPRSWRNWGRGRDVSAPPRPGPTAWKGFSGGVRLRDSSGGERGGCRGSPAAAALPPPGQRPCVSTRPRPRAPQTAGDPRTQPRAAPAPAARASRAPRLSAPSRSGSHAWGRGGCCSPSAAETRRDVSPAGFAGRKLEQPLQTGPDDLDSVALQLLGAI